MSPKHASKKPSQKAPDADPGMNDAERVEGAERVDNVGERRPDAEGGDERMVKHPNDRENERMDEADADGEGYETERSGAV